MAELSKLGSATAAVTSRARTRPCAAASGTVSSASGATQGRDDRLVFLDRAHAPILAGS